MARDKMPINWGIPGQTGITKDGIPWRVPENGPTRRDHFMRWLFQVNGSYYPVGARLIPARTAAEVKERCLRKYHGKVAALLPEDEQVDGFIGFILDDHVPQPPRGRLEATVGPNPLKHWWMGGDWNSMAGRMVIAIGSSRTHDLTGPSALKRNDLWVRTDRRIVIMAGDMETPLLIEADFRLDQVGLRPGWKPGEVKGEPWRIDIAFADGSWLGMHGRDLKVPGWTEGFPVRDLLAELGGPPVTAACLPARGRG